MFRRLYYRYLRVLDKYSPDTNVYVGSSFDVCATDAFGKPCSYAKLDYKKKVAVCDNNMRSHKCSKKVLQEGDLDQKLK